MGRCDVCNCPLNASDGYLLTTREIVTNSDYWYICFRVSIEIKGHPYSAVKSMASRILTRTASNDTPWMLCDTCVDMFPIDRNAARKKARKWSRTGRPSGGFALCKVLGHGKVYGRDFDEIEVYDNEGLALAQKAADEALERLA